MNIKVVFMGTPEFAVPILDVLVNKTNVELVVTQPDREVGRKKVLTSSPVKNRAREYKIEVFQPNKIREDFEIIRKIKPDLIVTCAYGQILPQELLDIPRLGAINVHASLLPKYRGGAPIERAIINGDDKTGITIMYMDAGMDTGDIIKMESIPINDNDTNESMHEKLSLLGAKLLDEILPDIIKGTNERIKQNDAEATIARIIKREDEHLDFRKTAQEIDNQVRGLYSWPLANMIINGEEIKVLEGYIGGDKKGEEGLIVDVSKNGLGINTSDKVYYITKLKPSGKKAMLIGDYLNGVRKENLISKRVM